MENLKQKTENQKQNQSIKTQKSKLFDLDKRTLEFAKSVRDYIKSAPKNLCNLEYGKQLVRSSGSVGANYIEAEQSLSKKDFVMRIKICRKEAKESKYWLELTESNENETGRQHLIKEALELTKIFGAIVEKSQ